MLSDMREMMLFMREEELGHAGVEAILMDAEPTFSELPNEVS